jgi:hypothetical protein
MTSKIHLRMTASELAMGRLMRAPDHPPAEDDFTKAFDQLVIDDKAAEPAAETPPAEPAPEVPPAEPAAETPPAEPAAETPPAEPAPEAPPAEPVAEAPAEPAATPKLSDEEADAIMKRLAGHIKETPEAPAAEAEPDAEPIYSQAEIDTLTKFEEDWAEVATAMKLRDKAFGRALISYAFAEIEKEIAPMRQLLDGLAGRAHVKDIHEKVGEYTDDERQACIDWVNSQPDYLQSAYTNVINDGTASQVSDLIGRFREATGRAAPTAAAPSQDPPKDTELSGKAKQAAKALAPVRSERSVVAEPDDKSNFDQAWDRFAAEG